MTTTTPPIALALDFALTGTIEADDPYAAVKDWLAAAPFGVVTFSELEIDGDGYEVDSFADRARGLRPVGLRARIEGRKAS